MGRSRRNEPERDREDFFPRRPLSASFRAAWPPSSRDGGSKAPRITKFAGEKRKHQHEKTNTNSVRHLPDVQSVYCSRTGDGLFRAFTRSASRYPGAGRSLPGYNTAEGLNALLPAIPGVWNTAIGAYALSSSAPGGLGNTAVVLIPSAITPPATSIVLLGSIRSCQLNRQPKCRYWLSSARFEHDGHPQHGRRVPSALCQQRQRQHGRRLSSAPEQYRRHRKHCYRPASALSQHRRRQHGQRC